MVDVSVDGEKAVFEVEGLDKLWCLRSRLEIPLAHIKGVRADPDGGARLVARVPPARHEHPGPAHRRHLLP